MLRGKTLIMIALMAAAITVALAGGAAPRGQAGNLGKPTSLEVINLAAERLNIFQAGKIYTTNEPIIFDTHFIIAAKGSGRADLSKTNSAFDTVLTTSNGDVAVVEIKNSNKFFDLLSGGKNGFRYSQRMTVLDGKNYEFSSKNINTRVVVHGVNVRKQICFDVSASLKDASIKTGAALSEGETMILEWTTESGEQVYFLVTPYRLRAPTKE